MKSLNNKNKLTPVNIFYLLLLVLSTNACGVDADQRNFERKALSPPEGITEMTATGPLKGEKVDKSDWLIAPEYIGLVDIQPAPYPNPIHFGNEIYIHFHVLHDLVIKGLRVFVYRPQKNNLSNPIYINLQKLNLGLTVIKLSSAKIARRVVTPENLYRIIIYDGAQNIITYGDVKVK